MRIIDDKITGNNLSVLGKEYHEKLNLVTKKKCYNKSYPAGKIENYADNANETYQIVYIYRIILMIYSMVI